jgi:hypothetical protein
MDAEGLIDVRRAAEMLGVSPRRVRALVAAGRLSPIRVNPRFHLFRRGEVIEFAQRKRRAGRPRHQVSGTGMNPDGSSATDRR